MSEKIVRISRPLSWRHDFIRTHDYRCHYCNRFAGSVEVGPDGKPWHVDHMDALAAGGADVDENLTLACERCNCLKHTLPYENFRRYAREVFWVGEPSRLDLKDLEYLEAAYLRTSSGSFIHRHIDSPDMGDMQRLIALTEGEASVDQAEPIADFCVGGGRTGGEHNLRFFIHAHRLAPKLIAEIHLLHAELAVLRGDTQAASDAA